MPLLTDVIDGTRAPNGRGATALYIAPTKALAADQLDRIARLALPAVRPATYDGDTPTDERRWIRDHANVVLTNPDLVPLPFGFGTHPYFKLPLAGGSRFENCLVQAPAAKRYELVDCLPTGRLFSVGEKTNTGAEETVDLRDGAVTYDERHRRKRPDWTYADADADD